MNNQPRVPAGSPNGGQWTDGAAPLSPAEQTRALAVLASVPNVPVEEKWFGVNGKDEISIKGEFAQGAIYGLPSPEALSKKAIVAEVPIRELRRSQPTVQRDHIATTIRGQNTNTQLPVVVRENGQYYLQEGHHRVVSQWFAGRQTSKVLLVEFQNGKFVRPRG